MRIISFKPRRHSVFFPRHSERSEESTSHSGASAIESHIQKEYDLIAADYALKRSYQRSEKMKRLSSYLGQAKRILDLGCGSGRFYEFVPKSYHYVGLDFSKKLLAFAQKKYPTAKFVYGDMIKSQVWHKLGRFDRIFMFASLHHLLNKKLQTRVIRLITQALNKNGLLIITVWNLWKMAYWTRHIEQLAGKKILIPYKLSNGKKVTKTVYRHYYAFTPWELKRLVAKNGLLVQKTFYLKGKNIFTAQEIALVAKKVVKSV